MEWSKEAENALKKVPFFVRKKVKSRIEDETFKAGTRKVSIADVRAAKNRFLKNMESEIQGYRVEACFGRDGCPNRTIQSRQLLDRLEKLFRQENILGFLKQHVEGDLKFHHEFRTGIADCPNSCSQPQIKDIGIIGARLPAVTDKDCTLCNVCVEICREKAVAIHDQEKRAVIDIKQCLACGQCIDACPTGTIKEKKAGFRIQLGGKLGRHPKLAEELPGIYSEDEVIDIVKDSIAFYKNNSRKGWRFAELYRDFSFIESVDIHDNRN